MPKRIKYKYLTQKAHSYLVEGEYWPTFSSPYLYVLAHPKGTKVVVATNYAWDGCSPKIRFMDLEFGTPEGVTNWQTKQPITYRASLVHDAIYQYKHQHQISRKQADKLFLQVLQQEQFAWAKAYYYAVRAFGWLCNFSFDKAHFHIIYKPWKKR